MGQKGEAWGFAKRPSFLVSPARLSLFLGRDHRVGSSVEKGPHLWDPHTAQPPLLSQDHRFSNSRSRKSFKVTQDRHDEKPDRRWG